MSNILKGFLLGCLCVVLSVTYCIILLDEESNDTIYTLFAGIIGQTLSMSILFCEFG